jgi:hypothetical protein
MKTEAAERLLQQARQILEDEKNGLKPSKERIEWARSILAANALWK